jgi:hypothetical protein
VALARNELWGVWGGLSAQERLPAARLFDAGRTVADIITAHDAVFYARTEANARRLAAERARRAEAVPPGAAVRDENGRFAGTAARDRSAREAA